MATRPRGSSTENGTLKMILPAMKVTRARSEVLNIPPRARPNSNAMREVGASKYCSRRPISFSQ